MKLRAFIGHCRPWLIQISRRGLETDNSPQPEVRSSCNGTAGSDLLRSATQHLLVPCSTDRVSPIPTVLPRPECPLRRGLRPLSLHDTLGSPGHGGPVLQLLGLVAGEAGLGLQGDGLGVRQ